MDQCAELLTLRVTILRRIYLAAMAAATPAYYVAKSEERSDKLFVTKWFLTTPGGQQRETYQK
jgi:hypothetical protein